MRKEFCLGSITMCSVAFLLGLAAQARTFEFKQFKSTGSKANSDYYWMGTEKSKSAWYQVKIGGASQIDDVGEMEIRAATVFKNVKDRKTGVNDVAKFRFDPINKGKAIYFMVSSGVALSVERDNDYWYGGNDGRANKGWQLAGCIIEIWQNGKVVKHWSGAGAAGKMSLADGVPLLRINRDGYPSVGDRNRFARDFDNATEIFSVDQKGERVDIENVLKSFREDEGGSTGRSEKGSGASAKASAMNAVASKLRQCDFLLNEKFKRNAKFYLCLFSASWCPPCRQEMPRIAKTYVETLKDDPDIELIHFSRDRDDEKALAWAKEHDVKFPVVKPQGGNPLDLHTRGIPHLFIVKADGTVLEEGHPMRIFNEEKFREIKGSCSAGIGKSRASDDDDKNSSDGNTNGLGSKELFVLTGPYGIRITADPGCEKGAEYVLKRLKEDYLPAAEEYYGNPLQNRSSARVYEITVKRNDGRSGSSYTGPSYRPGTGSWVIRLPKDADRFELSLDYLASSILTVCRDAKWASFVFYVNRLVEGKAKGVDPIPRLKDDIRKGLSNDDTKVNKWYRNHAPLWAVLEELREKHPAFIRKYCTLKNKRHAEGDLPDYLSLDQMAALLGEVTGEDVAELFKKYGVKTE